MKRIILLITAVSLTLCIANAESTEPTIQDFYAGSEIEVNVDKPLAQTLVPYHVYESVISSNLNDIRVFNASGGLVPHRVASQKKDSQTSTKVLSFAKLTSNSDGPSGLENLIEKYKSLGIDINLNLQAEDTDASGSKVDIYIGEIGELGNKATELQLDWELDPRVSAFFSAEIEISNDFKNWQNVARSVNLAQLKTNETIVKHNQIKLNRFNKKFYRLSIHGERKPDIKKIELVVNQQHERPFSVTEDVIGKHDKNNKQIAYYLQSAKIIKKQLKVQIPENNVMANCRVYSREFDDNNWTQRGSGTVYKITNDGEILKNEVIQLTPSSDPEWKLEVITRGSGFEQQPPVINFLWQPHVLTFVVRGESPFTLAYGSAAYATKSVSQNSFFNTASKEEAQLVANSLTSSKIDILGGENVLQENLIKVTPKTMALWGILIVGSLFLLLMAFSLLKGTPKADE